MGLRWVGAAGPRPPRSRGSSWLVNVWWLDMVNRAYTNNTDPPPMRTGERGGVKTGPLSADPADSEWTPVPHDDEPWNFCLRLFCCLYKNSIKGFKPGFPLIHSSSVWIFYKQNGSEAVGMNLLINNLIWPPDWSQVTAWWCRLEVRNVLMEHI